ncbi:MAG: hypothetical protein F4Y63_08225 [Chloroflexi bacterium]|nr:hypothetical protein [Chloroflexota bacterium]
MIKVVSWNIAKRQEPWRELVKMDADVALLQEAGDPPWNLTDKVDTGPQEHWDSHLWNSNWYRRHGWRYIADRWPKVVRLSDRVEIEWFDQDGPRGSGSQGTIPVSGAGNIAVAKVKPLNSDQRPFLVASIYASWIGARPTAFSKWRVGMPDGSAHRAISDLSVFVGDADPLTYRILAAGDLNMDYGWTDDEPLGLGARERSVWDRFKALGFEYLGPQHPNGRQPNPAPKHLPPDTKNVSTFRSNYMSPMTAQLQLDHVFASRGFHEGIKTRALNCVCQWGSSDGGEWVIRPRFAV